MSPGGAVYFATSALNQRLDLLQHLMDFGSGMALVTGPQGSGKSALLTELSARLQVDGAPSRLTRLQADALLTPEALLAGLAGRLGLDYSPDQPLAEGEQLLRQQGQQAAAEGLPLLLAVDDADLLPPGALALLARLTLPEAAAMHVLLTGTPALARTAGTALRALSEPRVPHTLDLPPFSTVETEAFLNHIGAPRDLVREAVRVRAATHGLPGLIVDLARSQLDDSAVLAGPAAEAGLPLETGMQPAAGGAARPHGRSGPPAADWQLPGARTIALMGAGLVAGFSVIWALSEFDGEQRAAPPPVRVVLDLPASDQGQVQRPGPLPDQEDGPVGAESAVGDPATRGAAALPPSSPSVAAPAGGQGGSPPAATPAPGATSERAAAVPPSSPAVAAPAGGQRGSVPAAAPTPGAASERAAAVPPSSPAVAAPAGGQGGSAPTATPTPGAASERIAAVPPPSAAPVPAGGQGGSAPTATPTPGAASERIAAVPPPSAAPAPAGGQGGSAPAATPAPEAASERAAAVPPSSAVPAPAGGQGGSAPVATPAPEAASERRAVPLAPVMRSDRGPAVPPVPSVGSEAPPPATAGAPTAGGSTAPGRTDGDPWGPAWLRAQAPERWVLQLYAGASRESALAFIARHGLQRRVALFPTRRGGRLLHVVVEGLYASRAQAEQARAALPRALRELRPWPRTIKAVTEAIAADAAAP